MPTNRPLNSTERTVMRGVTQAAVVFSETAQTSAWMRLFSKVNSILVGRHIPVTAEPSLPAPAMTDGKVIKFSADWVSRAVLRRLHSGATSEAKVGAAMLKGINYHELAHVLFSPNRTDSDYARALVRLAGANRPEFTSERDFWIPANLIEDQRIEMLFSAMYPGAKMYFRASALNAMLKDEEGNNAKAGVSFVFTHGRRYLPRSLRKAHRVEAEATYGPALVQQWADLVDEYTSLSLNRDADRAAELVMEATRLLRQMNVTPPAMDHDGSAPGKTDQSNPTASDRKREDAAADKARGEVADDNEADDEPAAGANSDSAEEAEGEGDGEGGTSGDDADENADENGDASGGGDTSGESDEEPEGDSTSGNGSGADDDNDGEEGEDGKGGNGGGFSEQSSDQPTTAAEALEDLLGDAQFDRELDNLISDFQSEAERGDVEKPRKTRTGMHTVPTPEQTGTANRLHKVLMQMRADAGDSYERRLSEGRVNVIDFMTRNPWEIDVFVHHEEGHEDEFDMEVVILLDMSPSMSYLSQRASLALWQIKHAMQRMDIPVTAYGYNDGAAKCLYTPHDVVTSNAYENFGHGGYGTDPLDALTRAYNILSRSSARRKILITITDGEWNGQSRLQSDAVVQKINGLRGATSIIIGLCSYPGQLLRTDDRTSYHQHQMGREVTDPVQILDVFKDYVYSVGRKAALH